MNLDQLEVLLKSAKTAQDLFGGDPDKTYREWALICHPDRFASSTDDVKEHAKDVFTLLEKRHEELKTPPTIWTSPDFEYHLGPQLGSGEVSKAYLATQKKGGDSKPVILKVAHVKEANEYIEKEAKILADMRVQAGDRKYSEYLAKPIELFTHDELLVAAQQHYDGFYTINDYMAKYPKGVGGRHIAWMFNRTLTILGFAHTINYMHCAVLPTHLLFNNINRGCKLISWASSCRMEQKLSVLPLAFKPWYPKLEITKQYPATPSLDIFLAAKTMLEMCKQHEPGAIPSQLLVFLESCVNPKPLQRPQDAWKLLDEWRHLLKKVYGPPRYDALPM
ncbi:MAG: serine/threonine-protein kinase [Candidatus Paceibacterota bacterium]|jgi:serine/threonine protein kinase